MQLFHIRCLKSLSFRITICRDKFNRAAFILALAFLDFEDGEADPLSQLAILANDSAIVFLARLRMQRIDQVVHLSLAISRIARSHQRFGGRCQNAAVEIGLATISVGNIATAGAMGWHGRFENLVLRLTD